MNIFKRLQNLEAPADTTGGVVNTESMSDEEILNTDITELNSDEDENDDTTTIEESESEVEDSEEQSPEEESDTEETEEEEEEEETESEEELTEPQKATFAGLKKDYPDIFKKYPELAKAFGKANQYEEVFPTVEEARESAQELEAFRDIATDLQSGNPLKMLSNLAQQDVNSVIEFSRNVLPALHRIHPDLFHEAATPVVTHLLNNVMKAASGMTDERYANNLKLAVKYISHHLFGETNVPEIRRQENRPDPEKMRLIREREEFMNLRLNESAMEVQNTLKPEMIKLVGVQLKSLKGQTPYVMKKLRSDIIREIDNTLTRDDNFIKSVQGLWRRLAKSGFSDTSTKSRIKSAYLERSRQLVESVAKSVLKREGLIGSKNVVHRDTSSSARGNRGPNNNTRNINPKNIDFKKTSDLDILGGKITTKQ